MTVCDPHWTAYLSLGTPIAAIVAAGIAAFYARRQAETARNRLILDLFDRRFPLYNATIELFRTIFTTGVLKDEEIITYMTAVRPARFLLNVELESYLLKTIADKAFDLTMLNAEFSTLTDDERRENVRKQRAIKDWFNNERNTIDDRFSEFMQLRH